MTNISIYLNEQQQKKLDALTKKGLAQEIAENIPTERSRSALIGLMVEQEYLKLIEAEMIADAVIIDQENLGWSEAEESCQIIDSEVSG
ncbi:MAG: hypothetical protein RLZZ381_2456 [Cyanobacteriota bacterium]|jgi:hypothetical protein